MTTEECGRGPVKPALRAAALRDAHRPAGFDGWVLDHPLVTDLVPDLCVDFPDSGFSRHRAGAGDGLRGTLDVFTLATGEQMAHLASCWRDLLDEVLSERYDRLVEDLVKRSLTRTEKRIRFLSYGPGSFLEEHWDHQPGKILTQIFYGNREWPARWGGRLELLCHRPDGVQSITALPPTADVSVIIRSTPRAIHRVETVAGEAAEPRRVAMLEWYAP